MKVSIRRRYALLLAAALTALVAFADYSTGKEVSLDVYYLVPIVLASWTGGFAVGIGFSLASLALVIFMATAIGHPFASSFYFYFDAFSIFLAFVLVAQLASMFRKSHDTLQQTSTIDALTGINNRAAFVEAVRMEILRQRRVPKPFALAYIDCDNFKPINDRYGHEHGDSLLISVARTLTQSVRKTDTVARLGGDEFAVLLPRTEAEQSNVIVRQLREKLTERMTSKNWQVSFSFGIAVYTRPPGSVEDAIRQAEALMSRVKQVGKDGALQEVF